MCTMVKLIDVAREAGVSPATVSRVLNDSVLVTDEKKQIVLAAVEKLGYVPLRPLATERAERPELLTSSPSEQAPHIIVSIHSPINSLLQSSILWTAHKLGYQVICAPISEDRNLDAEHLIDLLQSLRRCNLLAGVLLCSPVLFPSPALIHQLSLCPVVQIGKHLALDNSAIASVEDQQLTYEAVKYLYQSGKKKPVLFVHNLQADTPAYEQRRIWGYRLAMMELGLDMSQMLIQEVDDTLEGGTEAILTLLQNGHHPDAILCCSDQAAMGCIKAFLGLGWKIPEQVAILGLEDSGVGLFGPVELSTIAAPQFKAGETAIHLLHRLITKSIDSNYIAALPHQLIIRDSSDPQSGSPVHQWQQGHWDDTEFM